MPAKLVQHRHHRGGIGAQAELKSNKDAALAVMEG
jgi:hypothetical protein